MSLSLQRVWPESWLFGLIAICVVFLFIYLRRSPSGQSFVNDHGEPIKELNVADLRLKLLQRLERICTLINYNVLRCKHKVRKCLSRAKLWLVATRM